MEERLLPKMTRVPVDSDAIISSFVPFQSKQNQKSNKKIKFQSAMLCCQAKGRFSSVYV